MRLVDAWSQLDIALGSAEAFWRPVPFRMAASSSTAWRSPAHEAALTLSNTEYDALATADDETLIQWFLDSVPSGREKYEPLLPVLQALPEETVRPRVSGVGTSPPARRTLQRAAAGIPGRKWEQIMAFSKLLDGGAGPPRVVDSCSGKGHLARALHACGCCESVHCLELDARLGDAGRSLSLAAQQINFHTHDILRDPLPLALRGSEFTHTALHACGALHRAVLRTAVRERAGRVIIVPCCYEKFEAPASAFTPLSATVRDRSTLSLTIQDLTLAVADVVSTSSRRERELQARERSWRLAFDVWQRSVITAERMDPLAGEAGYSAAAAATDEALQPRARHLTVPSCPSQLLKNAAGFQAFCQFCVTADGRNAAARRALAPALNAELVRDGPGALEAYAARGETLRREVERLELVRRAFARPMELWLATDLALALEESGTYSSVHLRHLCDSKVTPRNIAVVAER